MMIQIKKIIKRIYKDIQILIKDLSIIIIFSIGCASIFVGVTYIVQYFLCWLLDKPINDESLRGTIAILVLIFCIVCFINEIYLYFKKIIKEINSE